MKLQSIEAKSLQEIEGSRVGIINYARYIFERTQPSCIYAFSQFRNEEDLFLLILAKKKGVFDYGSLITRDGVDAWHHPSPVEVMQNLNSVIATKSHKRLNTRNEMKKYLLSLIDIDIKVNKDFQDPDAWKALSENEKIAKKTEMLTQFYEKNGKRELQRKHYEIMRERTARGESPEAIIKRIAESNWEPIEARKVEEVEVSDAWKRVAKSAESIEDIGQVMDLKKEIDSLREKLLEAENSIEELSGKFRGLLDRVVELESQPKASIKEPLPRVKEPVIQEKKYTESDLCMLSLKELKEIAKSMDIKGAESALIPTFLIKKILAA